MRKLKRNQKKSMAPFNYYYYYFFKRVKKEPPFFAFANACCCACLFNFEYFFDLAVEREREGGGLF